MPPNARVAGLGGEGTFPGTFGNGEVAPTPDLLGSGIGVSARRLAVVRSARAREPCLC
jgi:hypothetical protein